MEYVQTVLVQIDASKIDEASRPQGLLAALDEHRSYLEQQPGYEEMRVSRSINAEGNVLLVIETRWADDNSLVSYETREPNVASIIDRHQGLIVADSLQVLDMEAVRAAARPPTPAAQATERLALPLLMPVGILAFALLVIYGLSRIYLEIDNEVATGLAAGIALGILVVAWYIASRPSVAGWQIATIAVAAAALLTGGAIFAVVDEDDGEAGAEEPTATASPTPAGSPSPGGPTGALAVSLGDNFFEFEGEREPTIPLTVGAEITIDLTNDGLAPHNMHIAGTDNEYGLPFCRPGEEEPCSDPELIPPGETGTIAFRFDETGTFVFRCDFHPAQMFGKIEAQ